MLHMSKLSCYIRQSCHVSYDKVSMLQMTKLSLMTNLSCYIWQSFFLHMTKLQCYIYVKVGMLQMTKFLCYIWQHFNVTYDKVFMLHGHLTKWSPGKMVTWQNSHLTKWSPGKIVTWQNGHLAKWSPSKRKCLIPAMVSDTEYQRENNFIF